MLDVQPCLATHHLHPTQREQAKEPGIIITFRIEQACISGQIRAQSVVKVAERCAPAPTVIHIAVAVHRRLAIAELHDSRQRAKNGQGLDVEEHYELWLYNEDAPIRSKMMRLCLRRMRNESSRKTEDDSRSVKSERRKKISCWRQYYFIYCFPWHSRSSQ